MLGRILNKLRRSFRRHGVLGTARHAASKFLRPLLELTPARRRERRLKEEKDRAFDARHGTDTGGVIELTQLAIAGASRDFGNSYWATDPDDFARLLGAIDIDHRAFTFVDFGSGKGRAVLLASGFPFRKVVGVEFSPELDRIARENVAQFRGDRRQCHEIELVCGDALEYPLPDGPCVLYFYNPFGKEIMEGVAARVERSYRENPREIYVLYANPTQAEVWERAGCFRKVASPGNAVIYQTDPPAGHAGQDA